MAVAVVVVGLLAVPTSVPSASSDHANRLRVSSGTVGSCPGSVGPSRFEGALSAPNAGASPPHVANVSLALYYALQTNVTHASSTSSSCSHEVVYFTTRSDGSFSVTVPIPGIGCTLGVCTSYHGPFGAVTFANATPLPWGDYFSASVNGSTVALAFVAALSSVELTPTGRATVSVDAPTPVEAIASAADGSPTRAHAIFAWRLAGVGWAITSTTGSVATVEASSGAGPGTLEEWTNGTYNGSVIELTPVTLELTAVATTATGGSVSPSLVDAGAPVSVEFTATASGGYGYRAIVDPGLGGSNDSVGCGTTASTYGRVVVTCLATLRYANPGTAEPVATVTNGYSSSTEPLPNVSVDPGLSVSVGPDPAVGYVGAPITLHVGVGVGVGTPPYGSACFYPASGTPVCQRGGGLPAALSVEFPTAGRYPGSVTLSDSGGLNATVPETVIAVNRPDLDPLVASTGALVVGSTDEIEARVTGGALPLQYWWNDSSPAGTLTSGVVVSDVAIPLDYVGLTTGAHTLTLTVVDALGTAVARTALVAVVPGPAVRIVASDPAPASAAAGAPMTFDWEAVDAAGSVVPSYASPVVLAPPPGAWWVNTSAGPISAAPDGAFPLPASAWADGHLEFTIVGVVAGTARFDVGTALTVSAAPGGLLSVSVTPALTELELTHPSVVTAGDRTNATRYDVSDRFGNAVHVGYVVVRSVFAGEAANNDSPIRAGPGGSTVWVNFSAPNGVGGVVYVLSEWGQELLAPRSVPAPAAPGPDVGTLLVTALLASTTVALAVVAVRGRSAARRRLSESEDAELERFADGRAHVLRIAGRGRPFDLEEVARAWPGAERPEPDEVSDWVGALVSEGSLTAVRYASRIRFVARRPRDPPGPLKVEVDPDALLRALDDAWRNER